MSNQEQGEKLLSMFAKTRALRALIETKNRENAMCTCVLDGAECYCNAIFLLLNGNYVFPAMALMRCLCELAVKLMWCLRPDDTDKEQDKKTVDDKVCQWEKSTLAQYIKVLKEWKNVDPQNNNIDDQIKKLEDIKATMDINEMPNYPQLLEKLPIEFRRVMSLELYKKFNNAVHLDTNSLGEIYLCNNNTNANNNDISKLKDRCVRLAEIITGVIAINKSGEGPESNTVMVVL
jgi:hypothetical protein